MPSAIGPASLMKTRDPFHQALGALSAFAGANRFGWGEPLVATALAHELKLSPTPVREALARLSGEGLIEHRPGRGYFAPSPTAADVADTYALHHRAVDWALDLVETRRGSAIPETEATLEGLFVDIVQAARNPQLTRMHWRVTLQLRPIRLIEEGVAPLDPAWTFDAQTLWRAGDLPTLRRKIEEYHRNRAGISAEVVETMRAAWKSIDQI